MLNWLEQFKCPDLATIYSLLASYMHFPSPGNLEEAKHVGKYILSTMDLGLLFTLQSNAQLESYICFPVEEQPSPPLLLPILLSLPSVMQTGVYRMHLVPLLQVCVRHEYKKPNPSVPIFSSMVVVQSCRTFTKKLVSVTLPVRLRSKPQTNV